MANNTSQLIRKWDKHSGERGPQHILTNQTVTNIGRINGHRNILKLKLLIGKTGKQFEIRRFKEHFSSYKIKDDNKSLYGIY